MAKGNIGLILWQVPFYFDFRYFVKAPSIRRHCIIENSMSRVTLLGYTVNVNGYGS